MARSKDIYSFPFYVLIIAMNAMEIILIIKKKCRVRSETMLLSLSAGDLMLGIIGVIGFLMDIKLLPYNRPCEIIVNSFIIFSISSSVLNILLITVDRFLAVVFPMQRNIWMKNSNLYAYIATIWVVSLSSSPLLAWYTITSNSDTYSFVLAFEVLPTIVVIGIVYALVYRKLKRTQLLRASRNGIKMKTSSNSTASVFFSKFRKTKHDLMEEVITRQFSHTAEKTIGATVNCHLSNNVQVNETLQVGKEWPNSETIRKEIENRPEETVGIGLKDVTVKSFSRNPGSIKGSKEEAWENIENVIFNDTESTLRSCYTNKKVNCDKILKSDEKMDFSYKTNMEKQNAENRSIEILSEDETINSRPTSSIFLYSDTHSSGLVRGGYDNSCESLHNVNKSGIMEELSAVIPKGNPDANATVKLKLIPKRDKTFTAERRVLYFGIAVVISFSICFLPATIVYLKFRKFNRQAVSWFALSYVFAVVNSVVNPILYFFYRYWDRLHCSNCCVVKNKVMVV